MTVAELIAFLQTQPQDLQVIYKCYSEQCLLESKDIVVDKFGPARPDGWVPDAYRHKDSLQDYLVFPGN